MRLNSLPNACIPAMLKRQNGTQLMSFLELSTSLWPRKSRNSAAAPWRR